MTDTERKALVERLGQVKNNQLLCIQAIAMINHQARAIEQHEAFRQEVSDAVEWVVNSTYMPAPSEHKLRRFIIAKPDPLVEVLDECGFGVSSNAADDIRAAIEARGGKIVWGEE